jgi:hypothetical protein
MAVFSYVVDHDHGYAPNPSPPYCSLVHCKYGKNGYKNIVELAKVGDWIIGTGGANKKTSVGRGRLVYAMRVTEKLPFERFLRDSRFKNRIDRHLPPRGESRAFALISEDYVYFGRNAPALQTLGIDPAGIVKSGPGFRYVQDRASFERLLDALPGRGIYGEPKDPVEQIVARVTAKGAYARAEREAIASATPATDPAACRCSESRNAACRARRRCAPSRRFARPLSRAGLR